MNNRIIYQLCCSFLFFFVMVEYDLCHLNNKNSPNKEESSQSKVVQSKCMQCHTPGSNFLGGQRLDKMYLKYGEDRLMKILIRDFEGKNNCGVLEHCKTVLTHDEVESVIRYLKNLAQITGHW